METNKDSHALSAAQIFGGDSSFWQHKVCADSRSDSLERRHQTTVGSRVMRTCCGRMLKFIRCVRKKLAGSSDVGSEVIDVGVGHYESNLTTKKCIADALLLSGS